MGEKPSNKSIQQLYKEEEERNMSVVAYLYAVRKDPLEKKLHTFQKIELLKQYSFDLTEGEILYIN